MIQQAFVRSRALVWFMTAFALIVLAPAARAQNQTPTLSPIVVNGDLPYIIDLVVRDMGEATIPTLQSYAVGQVGDEWVVLAGRTNGLHNFTSDGTQNFPPQFQNANVWVIDPVAQASWSRALTDPTSGLGPEQVDSLSATNTEFYQDGTTLYVAGGYVYDSVADDFTTYDTLSEINLPGVVDWVKTGTGSLAANLRQVSDPIVKVTGGIMTEIDGRTLLVFGQDFEGPYTGSADGIYTQQVRTFDIVDDGGSLAIANTAASAQAAEYRRRDLNVVPFLHRTGPEAYDEGLIAFSGVFLPGPTGGVWTVPVEIGADGTPSMADPNHPDTFKQGMNNYDSPTISLYSETDDSTHTLIFGGISLQYYDYSTGHFVTDDGAPFISQSTSIVRSTAGAYTQYLLDGADYPVSGVSGPLLFGAGARFLPATDLPKVGDFFDLDGLRGTVVLGQIYGGIMAVQGNGGPSTASSYVFDVLYTAVPEPGDLASTAIALTTVAVLAASRSRAARRIRPTPVRGA